MPIAVPAVTLNLVEPIPSRRRRRLRRRSSSSGSLRLLIRPGLCIRRRGERSVDTRLCLDCVAGKTDIDPLRRRGEVVRAVILVIPVRLRGCVGAVAEAGVGGEFSGGDGLGVAVGEVGGGDCVELGQAGVGDGGVGADGVLGGGGGGVVEGLVVLGGGGEEFDGGLFDLCVCLYC